MQTEKLKWHQRFQIEVGIHYNLFPTRTMTWKQWAFDPNFGFTKIGQEITSRYQLPESYYFGVDVLSVDGVDENDKDKYKYISLVFWVHGALRILGLDIGIGFFYRKQAPLKAIAPNKFEVGRYHV